MEKELIYNAIDKIYNEFPEIGEEILAAIEQCQVNILRKRAASVGNNYIFAILEKEYLNRRNIITIQAAAETLKQLAQQKEGIDCALPHLLHLTQPKRAKHYRLLVTKGLVISNTFHIFQLTDQGWKVLERAYKISQMKLIADPDFKKYIDFIGQ